MDIQEYQIAARSDITKVETAGKLANKPIEQKPRDVDFTNEVSFRQVKRVMLNCKFQDLADGRGEADEKEVKRM